jgi:hypothetical protein
VTAASAASVASAEVGSQRSRPGRVRQPTRRAPDEGSAIAEFVMVTALLLFVALAVFQLGLALYVRNTLISAATEGARLGARADAVPSDGVARAKALIASTLNETYARQVSVTRTTSPSGVLVLQVTVRAPLPIIGPIGPAEALTVTGRAFSEVQAVGAVP